MLQQCIGDLLTHRTVPFVCWDEPVALTCCSVPCCKQNTTASCAGVLLLCDPGVVQVYSLSFEHSHTACDRLTPDMVVYTTCCQTIFPALSPSAPLVTHLLCPRPLMLSVLAWTKWQRSCPQAKPPAQSSVSGDCSAAPHASTSVLSQQWCCCYGVTCGAAAEQQVAGAVVHRHSHHQEGVDGVHTDSNVYSVLAQPRHHACLCAMGLWGTAAAPQWRNAAQGTDTAKANSVPGALAAVWVLLQ